MIDSEIYQAFNDNPVAWENFKTFPKLYQRVRIDSIQRDKKKDRAVFDICLEKLIEQSEAGKCLVIGTIMADCLIKQQKIPVCRDDDKIAVKYLLRTNILNEKLLTN